MLYIFKSVANVLICYSIFVPPGELTGLLCDCGFYQVGLKQYTECPACAAETVCVGAIETDVVYVTRPQKERWAQEKPDAVPLLNTPLL